MSRPPRQIKTLVTGGCRSGKSSFALNMAGDKTDKIFIATAEALDGEMKQRIGRHRKSRGKSWKTIEAPIEVAEALAKNHVGVAVIDCVSLWLNNMMMAGMDDVEIEKKVAELAKEIGRAKCSVTVVTNEVGSGIVPENKSARRFRDLLGMANQRLAAACDRVVLMVAGLPLVVKEVTGGRISKNTRCN